MVRITWVKKHKRKNLVNKSNVIRHPRRIGGKVRIAKILFPKKGEDLFEGKNLCKKLKGFKRRQACLLDTLEKSTRLQDTIQLDILDDLVNNRPKEGELEKLLHEGKIRINSVFDNLNAMMLNFIDWDFSPLSTKAGYFKEKKESMEGNLANISAINNRIKELKDKNG